MNTDTSTSDLLSSIQAKLGENLNSLIEDAIREQVAATLTPDFITRAFEKNVAAALTKKLAQLTGTDTFKDKSIPGSAIDASMLRISGDNVIGGTITKFASNGIDDRASQCQITVLDQGLVVENTVYASGLDIKGSARIEGDLVLSGTINKDSQAFRDLAMEAITYTKQHLITEMFDQYQDRVYENIRSNGIDVSKLKIDGYEIVEKRGLTTYILTSHLQQVGVLKDLQSSGETYLSKTLYVSGSRVGINTVTPASALSVWDEEIEFGMAKFQQGVGIIGTRREHDLVLSSNRQQNLRLKPDGETQIGRLRVGAVLVSSSPTPPAYDAPQGTLILNEQPNLGGPVGWVSLGGARWANFGIVD
jgi:hypothetical protein